MGNINFSTTEDELKDFFGEYSVASVEIPSKVVTRGKKTINKRLGFGFVQFEKDTDAEEAIKKFNGLELKLRQIYAKRAMPPATEDERKERAAAKLKLFKEKKEQKLKEQQIEKNGKSGENTEKEPLANGDQKCESNGQQKDEVKSTKEKNGKSGRKSKKVKKTEAEAPHENGAAGTSDGLESEVKKESDSQEVPVPKAAKVPKTPEGVQSQTTVFVTNLDPRVNQKTLSGLFKPLEPVWCHVPTRKVPLHILKLTKARKVPVFNRGIAFVKFSSEEMQLRAIEQFNGHEFHGKNIVVEVAVDKVSEKEDEDKNDGEGEVSEESEQKGSESNSADSVQSEATV